MGKDVRGMSGVARVGGNRRRLKWHGVLFALLILFLYIMGIYDMVMMLSHNEAYYASKEFGESVSHYFTDYPVPGLILWIGNLMCGLIAPILYLWKKPYADQTAFASSLFDLLLIMFGAIFRDRFGVFPVAIICFDLFILVITFVFGVYLHLQENRSHRNEKA